MDSVAIAAAVRLVIGERLDDAMRAGRISLPERLKRACLDAFVDKLEGEHIELIRAAQKHIELGGYFS